PELPRIQARAVRVASITPVHLGLAVELEVHNPNSFPLMVRAANGKLAIGGDVEVGTGQATLNADVPADASSIVVADLTLNWTNIAALAPLAASASSVPYVFRGTAVLGGERLNANIPFTVNGEISREQVIQLGMSGLFPAHGSPGLQ
ncbi:MAG TPA: LEA type 2 family protein, partial [Polyangiaceae bacterium]|nr:LEA type 2 family protein [Polyangiaceae bacterium]